MCTPAETNLQYGVDMTSVLCAGLCEPGDMSNVIYVNLYQWEHTRDGGYDRGFILWVLCTVIIRAGIIMHGKTVTVNV